MSEDILLRYAGRSVAPEQRVHAFVDHDPRLRWVRDVTAKKGDVLLTGGSLRDVLLGHLPHVLHVGVDHIHPRSLRSILAKHGDVTLEGGTHAMTFAPKRNPSAHLYIARHAPERQDFTIDGLWYSAADATLVDPHNGLADLVARRIRTIGYPLRAFADDPLKVLRALRLAAERRLTFAPETWHALTRSLPRLNRVERTEHGPRFLHDRRHIGAALLETLSAEPRYGAALVHASGLGEMVAPELFADADQDAQAWDQARRALDILAHDNTLKAHGLSRLTATTITATLLAFHEKAHEIARDMTRRWHLHQFPADHNAHLNANDLQWYLENLRMFDNVDPASMSPSAFEKVFSSERGRNLLALMQATFLAEGKHHVARERLHVARRLLEHLHERKPTLKKLIRGRDLQSLGVLPGPQYRSLLSKIRDAQLTGAIQTRDDALAYLRHHVTQM